MEHQSELKPEAKQLLEKIKPKLFEKQEQINKIPIAVLIWGPSPSSNTKISEIRMDLRNLLREKGHLAMFSEELCNIQSDLSIRAQQMVQAESFDVIISIPETPGAIGEIHDFTSDMRVHNKILVFLKKEYAEGYSSQSLLAISNILSCEVVTYNDDDFNTIIEKSLEMMQKLREYKYFFQWRI